MGQQRVESITVLRIFEFIDVAIKHRRQRRTLTLVWIIPVDLALLLLASLEHGQDSIFSEIIGAYEGVDLALQIL